MTYGVDLSDYLFPDTGQGRLPSVVPTLNRNSYFFKDILSAVVSINGQYFDVANNCPLLSAGSAVPKAYPSPIGTTLLFNTANSPSYIQSANTFNVASGALLTAYSWFYDPNTLSGGGSTRSPARFLSSNTNYVSLNTDLPYYSFFWSAGAIRFVLSAASRSVGMHHTFGWFDGSLAYIDLDGTVTSGDTSSGAQNGGGNWVAQAGCLANTSAPGDFAPAVNILFGRLLTAAERIMLRVNPLQIFDIPLYVPFSVVASGTSVTLTGQYITGGQGSTAPDVEYSLSGQALTGGQGTATSAVTITLTGQVAQFYQGTVTPVVGGGTVVTLNGQSLTAAQGSISPALVASIVGQTMALGQGTVSIAGAYLTWADVPTIINMVFADPRMPGNYIG